METSKIKNSIREEAERIVEFFEYSGQLKEEMRLTWLPSGRRESSAEHSWNLALSAMIIGPKLKTKVDQTKIIKMCLIHDIAEIDAGDLPTCRYLGKNIETAEYEEKERQAIKEMQRRFGSSLTKEMIALWEEFENQITPEARLVRFLDKFEGRVQKALQQKEITEDEKRTEFVESYRKLMLDLSFEEDILIELTEIVHNKRVEMMKRKNER